MRVVSPKSLLLFLYVCILTAATPTVRAQQPPAAVISDPAPDKANPATMEAPDIPSGAVMLHAIIYIASGAGPHPAVILMHGFPGNERNFDLAYSIRRAGWNVLVPHYRGAWGSQGTFSFANAIEDTQACIQFLRDPANAARYRVAPKQIVLIGHSMGGFMVSRAAARDPRIMGVAMIAAWDIGLSKLPDMKHRGDAFKDDSPRLAGTTPESLVAEIEKDAAKLNYLDDAAALKDRPVLILEADDDNLGNNHTMAEALRKAGDKQVTETHMTTDHGFSDHRIALQSAVIEWLGTLVAKSN
jgi:pimeloyl-ACP methyl ester carboxylesterase